MTRSILGAVIAAFGVVVGASETAAQSAYGCTNLDDGSFAAALEGENGVFYRLQPDLDSYHALSPQSVADVAALSQALAAQGTTLVYLPVPTKALGMPGPLGPGAADYGFDVNIATTVYADTVRRLRGAGVVTVDARRALVNVATDAPSYLATDPRLTPAGTRRVAKSVADELAKLPAIAALPKATFTSVAQSAVPLNSADHQRIQRACLSDLPKPRVQAWATTLTEQANTANSRVPQIATVGTEMTGTAAMNFTGFLSEETGIQAAQYTVTGGGAFAAISSYVTSAAFQNARPDVLLWEVPIQSSLATYGDQPMAELLAAAQGASACRTPLLVAQGENGAIRVDLAQLDATAGYTLLLDTAGAPAREASFSFVSRQGLTRTRHIVRHSDQIATGRFYLPMTGLWQDGAAVVDIRTDAGFGSNPTVVACLEQEGT